jgi:hypothetical protein
MATGELRVGGGGGVPTSAMPHHSATENTPARGISPPRILPSIICGASTASQLRGQGAGSAELGGGDFRGLARASGP